MMTTTTLRTVQIFAEIARSSPKNARDRRSFAARFARRSVQELRVRRRKMRAIGAVLPLILRGNVRRKGEIKN